MSTEMMLRLEMADQPMGAADTVAAARAGRGAGFFLSFLAGALAPPSALAALCRSASQVGLEDEGFLFFFLFLFSVKDAMYWCCPDVGGGGGRGGGGSRGNPKALQALAADDALGNVCHKEKLGVVQQLRKGLLKVAHERVPSLWHRRQRLRGRLGRDRQLCRRCAFCLWLSNTL